MMPSYYCLISLVGTEYQTSDINLLFYKRLTCEVFFDYFTIIIYILGNLIFYSALFPEALWVYYYL